MHHEKDGWLYTKSFFGIGQNSITDPRNGKTYVNGKDGYKVKIYKHVPGEGRRPLRPGDPNSPSIYAYDIPYTVVRVFSIHESEDGGLVLHIDFKE